MTKKAYNNNNDDFIDNPRVTIQVYPCLRLRKEIQCQIMFYDVRRFTLKGMRIEYKDEKNVSCSKHIPQKHRESSYVS